MNPSVKYGIKTGLMIGWISIILAIPFYYKGFMLMIIKGGASSWPLDVENIIPLILLMIVANFARVRGYRAALVAAVSGIIYGIVSAISQWLVALIRPDKAYLMSQVSLAYKKTGHPLSAKTYAALHTSMFHPPLISPIIFTAIQMAVFGLALGWLSGRFNRNKSMSKTSS